MAKVIEFYAPKNFRKPLKRAPALDCGKIIEFCSPTPQLQHTGTFFPFDKGTSIAYRE
jgi:hypothetical protein